MVVILYVVALHHWFLSADLKRICKAIVEAASDEERLKAFAPIQEMMTFVQFANDECDYGMGLELGMDLFCYGSHVSKNSAFPHYPCIPTQVCTYILKFKCWEAMDPACISKSTFKEIFKSSKTV